jgi:hypothetical protein
VLAELAGFSQGYIAQIEAGSASLDRRISQQALAEALQISVGELTGRHGEAMPHHPVGPESVEILRSGILALACPDLAKVAGEFDPLAPGPKAALLDGYFDACQYDLLVPAVGQALRTLAYRSRTVTGSQLHAQQSESVEICSTAVSACLQLGHRDLAFIAAETAMRIARELADPAVVGLANYARIRAVSTEAAASQIARQGIELLGPYVGSDHEAASAYGMHHLVAAEIAARSGHGALALDHLAEAGRVAAHTGERPTDWFNFGPTNVAIWRVAILVALGDGPAALGPVPGPGVDVLPSAHRRATYYIDLSRALLQAKGMESTAAAVLYRAEAIAPQQVCVAENARIALRTLLSRPRFGRDGRLRGLADRSGIRD